MSAPAGIVHQLYDLIARLYDETDGFIDDPSDTQRWYNRGYANGMVKALRELSLVDELDRQLPLDADGIIGGHEAMAWGRAYTHGVDMGYRETFEVLPGQQRADT